VYELVVTVGTGIADMLQDDERPVNLMIHPDCDLEDGGPKPVGEKRAFAAKPCHQALATDPHALRILVHISIAFKSGLHLFDEAANVDKIAQSNLAMDNVIAAYIEFLRITKRFLLIPVYAAQLRQSRAIHCLARILPDIKNSDEQRRYIALLELYRIDIVNSIAQSITFALDHGGFTHFQGPQAVLNKPVDRLRILEKAPTTGDSLWPGYRIRQPFGESSIEPKEVAIIEALQWLQYIGNDYKHTFRHLEQTLIIFLSQYMKSSLCNDANLFSSTRSPCCCGEGCQQPQYGDFVPFENRSSVWIPIRFHAC
jgi:nuclear pore complex protein Nup107